MHRMQRKTTLLLLTALLFAVGCQSATEPAPLPPQSTETPAAAPPTPAWQEEALDNPLDDWFDEGEFEGVPQGAALVERAFDSLPVAEQAGLLVTLEAVRYVKDYALVFALQAENKTETALTLSVQDVAVNGWMQEALWLPLAAIPAGESAKCTLEIGALTLASFQHMAIDAIASLSLTLTATEETGAAFGTFAAALDDLDAEAAPQTYDDAGTELLLNDAVRVVYCGFDGEGYTMLFYAENRSDEALRIDLTPWYNETIAGVPCTVQLLPGCRAMLRTLPMETLYAAGVQELFFAAVDIALNDAAPVRVELF